MAIPDRLNATSLVLRRFEPVDAHALEAAFREGWDRLAPALGALVEGSDSTTALIAWMSEQFDSDERWHFGIFAPEGELLGGASLEPDGANGASLGFWLRAERQGRGYATTAAAHLTRLAFDDLGLAELRIITTADNHPSRAVADRLGFSCPPTGEPPGTLWRMTAAEFPASSAAARSATAIPEDAWRRLRARARQRFALADERPESFRIVWEFPRRTGERRHQLVEVARARRHGQPWIEVRADVAGNTGWGPGQALVRARTLTGALFFDGASLIVRCTLPLRGLTFDTFSRVLEVVGFEAALLGEQPANRASPAIFDGLYL
jgi:RimJ/RimL family protein N-acetyltransferase